MLERQIARLRLLGLLFCLGGGAMITAGWAGTARVACVDCQLPYLLSGGAAGLALIVVGVGLLLIAQLRAEAQRIVERLGGTPEPPASQAPAPAGTDPAGPEHSSAVAGQQDTAPLPPLGTPAQSPK